MYSWLINLHYCTIHLLLLGKYMKVRKDQTKRVLSATDNLVPNKDIQFGYHSAAGKQIRITNNGLGAEKMDPDGIQADGVVYGAQPLKGKAEFETEIVSYEARLSGSIGFGVMRCKKGILIKSIDIPNSPYDVVNYFVWIKQGLWNNLATVARGQTGYGYVDLDDLREGDRVGLYLSQDGVLEFTVNGENQGTAATNLYNRNYDLYAVVEHWGQCVATTVTKAGQCCHINFSTWLIYIYM